LPHILVKLADKINAKLIHLSTDCVFSGNKKSPYIESDKKDGIGNYAKTKGLGEVYNDRHLTIRTSVVGPEIRNNGEELFHWFMGQSDSIDGFTKVIWSGVTSLELARALKWSIDNSITGLYHVTNNSSISKHELMKLFQKYTNKDIIINPYDRIDLDKSFIDTRLLMDYKIPSYEQMIKQMIEFIRENDGLYRQYCL
jgi:dTDP-4-dehydrorhamnose reductase